MYRHVSTALLVAAFLAACKEKSAPPPTATAVPTAYVAPITTTNPQFQQVQPTVAVPLCDATLKECAPDPKVLEVCRKEETDQTKCENGIEKALYATLKTKVEAATQNAATTSEECKVTRYVNTQTDPLNVRDQGSTAGIIIGDVARAGSLCVIGQTSGSDGIWYKVNYVGKEGYVFGNLTSSSPPAAVATQPSTGSGTTDTAPASNPNAGCKNGTYRCKVKSGGLRGHNCWEDKGGERFEGMIRVDDDARMFRGGEIECFSLPQNVRVEWGLKHRTTQMRKSVSHGCYVEYSNLDCACKNLSCN